MTNKFIHLNVHSAYSLCEGAISIKNIVKLCQDKEMPAVALTDTHNLFGALEFSLACIKEGVQPIIGCKIFLEKNQTLILLCQSELGYQNLMHVVSGSYLSDKDYKIISMDTLRHHHEGLIAIGCPQTVDWHSIFKDRFYMGISRYGKNESDEDDRIKIAYSQNIPLVAINEVFFESPKYHEAHDILLCIGESRYVVEDNRRKVTTHHYFKSIQEMEELFLDIPEALENTVIISQRCQFLLTPQKPMLPPYLTEKTEEEELTEKAYEGLKIRLEKIEDQKPYFDRLEMELNVIKTMGFSGYFLIVADFIQWAKSQNIPVGPGRGSGAGSVVAWALTITNVDPMQYNLLFERFLNPERVSMPDFDIDFCQDRRDEVIEYVKQKYGEDKVVQISTFGSLQAKGVLRDITRVLQMPYSKTDEICKMIPNLATLDEALNADEAFRRLIESDDKLKHIFDIGMQLEGLYRHVSTHAAGVVIGGADLKKVVPLYREHGASMPATQFSMKYIEQAGLLKFDFLGLKTLTVIQHCCNKISIDISQIPLNDQKTFQILAQTKKIGGIFQFESHGMRDVLSKLRPDRFEDLIALTALYRPGPMDDIPNYLERKHGLQKTTYLHPLLEPILKETYGVMVYQEHVMHIAQKLAGFSLGGADLLRRAMGKKIKEEMDVQEKLFVEGAMKNGISEAVALQISSVMVKFARYGFPKAHAVTYALISYQTAYLKANYTKEFMASLMTLDSGNTDKLKGYFSEFPLLNIKLLQPCVNESMSDFSVQSQGVRYGLKAIKNVGENFVDVIVKERLKNGSFKNVADFLLRIPKENLNKRQLESLCLSGGLDSLHPNRKEIIDNIEKALRWAQSYQEEKKSIQQSLFDVEDITPQIDFFKPGYSDYDLLDKLSKEASVLGFYLSDHPLSLYEPFLDLFKLSDTRKIGLVKNAYERTSQKGNRYVIVSFSNLDGDFEVMFFQEKVELYRSLFKPGQVLILDVTLKDERMFGNKAESADDILNKMPVILDGVSLDETVDKICTWENGGQTKVEFQHFFEGQQVKVTLKNMKVPLSVRIT